ncbi:Tetratricopeptide repeat domain containing protein [Balamuthia mandrillaris]
MQQPEQGNEDTKQYSVEDLLRKAEDLLGQCQWELAQKFYTKALELAPENAQALAGLGGLMLEAGELEVAQELLTRSVALEPDRDPEKYFNLAQLLVGLDSITCFSRGIQLLIAQRAAKLENGEEVHELNRQISTAYCSAAEIYLTDACFEENAESECGRLLEEAQKYDNTDPEVYQLLASYKLSQGNVKEAAEALSHSYSLWSAAAELPSYEFRTNAAKLFLEVGNNATAKSILKVLVNEMDNIAEIWYLLGFAYAHLEPPNHDKALSSLETAKEVPCRLELLCHVIS